MLLYFMTGTYGYMAPEYATSGELWVTQLFARLPTLAMQALMYFLNTYKHVCALMWTFLLPNAISNLQEVLFISLCSLSCIKQSSQSLCILLNKVNQHFCAQTQNGLLINAISISKHAIWVSCPDPSEDLWQHRSLLKAPLPDLPGQVFPQFSASIDDMSNNA